MTKLTRMAILGTLFLFSIAADAPPPITLKVVKYEELTEAVRQLRGRVVVVDVWANYCVPCKREFPRLIALQRKYSKSGLTAVSVSLDANADDQRQAALDFLKREGAAFPNFLLDEPHSVWQAKFKIDGPPLVFLFNRKGELVRRYADAEVDYDKIHSKVASLLSE